MVLNDSIATAPEKKSGLLYWAQRAIEECDKAREGFAPDPVHDLRVAIRRCRSMADGFLSVDPDRGWKEMKRLGKPLFATLGELRDVQVMMEWVDKLSHPDDAARPILLLQLQVRETELKSAAQKELENFDREHWIGLNTRLSERAEKIPLDGTVFQLLALERWNEARELHRKALRNRSGPAYHQLRIGIKRLRYTVENFLPTLHAKWSKDLRDLQDALGEVHDFDVLWAALRAHPEVAPEVRAHWHEKLETERNRRLSLYRERMVGHLALWHNWRAALPKGESLESAAMEKLRLWASFFDREFDHATRVSQSALALYDGLVRCQVMQADPKQRSILEAAALLHEIGRSKSQNRHRKHTFRMLLKMTPPPAWSSADMRAVAIVARYHRGAVAPSSHKMFAGMSSSLRAQLLRLAGVLRLANAFDRILEQHGASPVVERRGDAIRITARNLNGHLGPQGEQLARAKYLLEASCGLPIRLEKAAPAQSKPSRNGNSLKRGPTARRLSRSASV
jgi:CHAD domain-containing protein